MEEDTKLKPQAANGAAQTASVGNHEMVTYMKMPTADESAQSSGGGSPSADLNFLDGLFDNSGSSDNGSEKGGAAAKAAAASGTVTGTTGLTVASVNNTKGQNTQTLTTDNVAAHYGAQATKPSKSHEVPAAGATIASADASMRPIALPVNPLLSNQQQQQHQHATRPQQVLTNNITTHPGKPTTFQQQHEDNGGGGATGTGNDQTNNATRTMSDVSSLTSSCGDGNTSPNLPYQTNEPTRSFPGLSSNIIMNNQQTNNVNNINSNMDQRNNQSFQTWVNTTTRDDGEELPPKVTFASNPGVMVSQVQQQQQYQQQYQQPNQQPNQHMLQQTISQPQPEPTTNKRRRGSFLETAHGGLNNASISEDEYEVQKRRRDRNLREQERSQRIANQILHLKEILAQSNIPFKPDKYSTLVSVHGYIKSLQQRVAVADAEQKKLVETITKTNELVNKAQNGLGGAAQNPTTPTQTVNEDGSPQLIPSSNVPVKEEEEELLQYIRGVDYKNAFARVNVALCVTRIDGRIIDCNQEFVRVFRLPMELLIKAGLRKGSPDKNASDLNQLYGKHPISIFNLIAREDMRMTFEAMSKMLSTSRTAEEAEQSNTQFDKLRNAFTSKEDHWASVVRCNAEGKFQFNISLIRRKDGTPNFFNCALVFMNDQQQSNALTSFKSEMG